MVAYLYYHIVKFLLKLHAIYTQENVWRIENSRTLLWSQELKGIFMKKLLCFYKENMANLRITQKGSK